MVPGLVENIIQETSFTIYTASYLLMFHAAVNLFAGIAFTDNQSQPVAFAISTACVCLPGIVLELLDPWRCDGKVVPKRR
jgi:hypothetical protein